jgi:hypothetical protein
MSLPKNSLHECKGCKFATSVQGYFNRCEKPQQVKKYKAFNYTEINRETCDEVDVPEELTC